MEGETAIEKSVREFVFAKIQEQVWLDVAKSNTICVQSRARQGSTALAMFWLRVLRHKNNYPMPKYPYKEVYDKQGTNKVILKVDSIKITTLMRCGTLIMQGSWVLEWFLNTFPTIIEAYDAPERVRSEPSTVYKQYTESWKTLQESDALRKAETDREERIREDRSLEILEDRENIIQTDTAKAYDRMKEDKETRIKKLRQAVEAAAEESREELELMTLNVWPVDVLESQLRKLQTCCVRDGSTYIYRLWRSLLHNWLADPDRKVYIVTPFLDATRLTDICNIVIQHRIEANLDSIYVRQKCDENGFGTIQQVKKQTLDKYDAKEQMYIEYKIFSAMIYPFKRFHAKFIGCMKGNEAEVLSTSANFHGDHFDYSNMETVHYQKMSDVEFISKFLGPINASVHDIDL
ncbi:hypothetical protein MAR_000051 [Mya arenaria]|nr:uncharacterized protein LOC128209432 [Mya arenaria]XP_052769588.1 uncharacterized protein LOC128209554 [Mya arenaria]WAR18213.1 hypothetical protein MAR_000051 [Mya arenaria]